jgi:hypothetical protein
MNALKETFSIPMTFGAVQLFVMDEKWKKHEEMHRIQDEKLTAMLEEMKEVVKRKWW